MQSGNTVLVCLVWSRGPLKMKSLQSFKQDHTAGELVSLNCADHSELNLVLSLIKWSSLHLCFITPVFCNLL